jgi:hypothetical protein
VLLVLRPGPLQQPKTVWTIHSMIEETLNVVELHTAQSSPLNALVLLPYDPLHGGACAPMLAESCPGKYI